MAALPLFSDSLSLRDYGASRGSHAHDHVQVLVGLAGVLELEVEGRGRRVGAGEGVVVAPGDRHDFEAAPGGSRCLVLDTADPLWTRSTGAPPAGERVGALARYLALCLEAPTPPVLALQQAPALLREAWGPMPVAAENRPRRAIDWLALAAWLRPRWHAPLTVADLAAQVHLSPGQFAERCRHELGTSPMHWLRAQRLHEARVLRTQGLGVAEAARRTGYRSPSALTAALRRVAGESEGALLLNR